MRIDSNPNSAGALSGANGASSDSRSTASKNRSTTAASDRAELSREQSRVTALTSEVTGLPEVRQERVTALSAAIRDGSYDVSPEQTAEAMISEMLGNAA
jgi:flagellar biosynthesis anti-sigma factor FlgM